MTGILIIGAGGHARSVMDALRASGREPGGMVDRTPGPGRSVCGVPIVGCDEDLHDLFLAGSREAALGVGSVGKSELRRAAVAHALEVGFAFDPVVHPSAIVSPEATLSRGVFVGAGAIVGPGTRVGEFAIINSGAIVDHDCTIGAYAHVAPGATLSGGVELKDDVHIGTGASIIQYLTIGRASIVGAGGVVVDNIEDGVTAYGNPCRVAGSRDVG